MQRAFCTYFDSNYLVKGLAMIESLLPRLSENEVLVVVAMDELTSHLLSQLELPSVEVLPFEQIEQCYPALLECKNSRSAVEYLWTSTPVIIDFILSNRPEFEIVTYIDADLYFFNSPADIYSELGDKSVLIHSHCFPERLKKYETYGIFNVGLVSFVNNSEGNEVITWWRDRCIEWCYARVEGTRFGDQGYLNDWPTRFPQVRVCENPGIGVAPWNHENYSLTISSNGQPKVDNNPLVFYHFHAFKIVHPSIVVPIFNEEYVIPESFLLYCFVPYCLALEQAAIRCREIIPGFSAGLYDHSVTISKQFTILFKRDVLENIKTLQRPQPLLDLHNSWFLLPSDQITPEGSQEVTQSVQ